MSSVQVFQADALAWLAANSAPQHTSAITSLPDQHELPQLSLPEWRTWFVDAARAVLRFLPHDGTAIFYQRDVRRDEVWIDKSQLLLGAAAAEGFELVWHKIVCRTAPGTAARAARPGYSHLLCMQREVRAPRKPLPDVLTDAGPSVWPRGMGLRACQLACDHLRNETPTKCVIDPFCGRGSALAVAAALGFDVIGVELHVRRSRATRALLTRSLATLAAVQRGAALFDGGDFFEAHEAWEERWRQAHDQDERLGLQGLIQVTAAFHKWFVMNSPESAQRLLARGTNKLEACAWLPGIALDELLAGLRACAEAMASAQLTREHVPPLLKLGAASGTETA
ncbi:MAG TPA: DUF309 domain-containing protein [Polyangiales bacterium]|nr:DUF309 domain-containing protein [Polyangiales bacterium]